MQRADVSTRDVANAQVANSDRVLRQYCNRRDAFILFVCIAVGLALRLDFMRAAGFTIDADEAIVGLMGRDILAGRGVPVFYYGQHYMGSLEALMASASFALLGATPFALQLVPLVWSLVLIVLAYCVGRLVAGRRAGSIAAVLMAVPPPALLVWSSKARGGFVELVVIGALALCLTIQWIRSSPDRLRYPIALGFVLGIGWWVNNQIIYFILPIAIISAVHVFSRSIWPAGAGSTSASVRTKWQNIAIIVGSGAVAFFVGGAPYWWYNIARGFPSAGMFKLASWERFVSHLDGLSSTALPAIVGAQRFWQSFPVFPFSRHLALLLYVFPIALLVVARWQKLLGLFVGRLDRTKPVEILVLFCLSCGLVFSISSFGWLVQAPRYLLPFYIGLYPLVAVCCDWVWSRSRFFGVAYLAALLVFQISASYVGGRGLSGEPVVFGGQRVARDHAPLIQTLERLQISHVRATYWIGYRLAFETGERITFTVLGEPTQARIPRYEVSDFTQRSELPLVLVQSEAVVVEPTLKRFGFAFKKERAGEYTVLFDLKTELPLSAAIDLRTVGYVARASGSNPAELAVDGDPTTRWGTGAPQSPGQTFEIELTKPALIDGVRYSYGAWFNDRPSELKVEVEDITGARTVVLSQRESPGAMHLSARDPYFTLRFKPIEGRKVVLTQLGRHPILDWSIAELAILGRTK